MRRHLPGQQVGRVPHDPGRTGGHARSTKAPARITTAGRIQISGRRDHSERAGTADGRSSKLGIVGSFMLRRIPQKPLVE